MVKDKGTLSANEINKYVYCNYQWYYERLYGTKELRRRYKEHIEELGLPDKAGGNFKRGLDYHAGYGSHSILRTLLKLLFAAAFVAAFIYYVLQSGLIRL